MPRGANAQSGFTLVETLVAVFALSLLMGAGGSVLLSTLEARSLVDERMERLGRLDVLTAHLRADLAGTLPRVVESALSAGRPQSFYGGPPDRDRVVLGLVREGWTNIEAGEDRSELATVFYRFENGGLARTLVTRPDSVRQTPEFETRLLEGVRDVKLRFTVNGVSSDSWELILDSEGRPALPEAISLDLIFITGEILSQSFLVGGRS